MQYFSYLCARFNILTEMKNRIGLILCALTFSMVLFAQTHITIDNPSTWSGEALRPYIGKKVVFDVPMYICTNTNGYTVSPWRKFQPQSHGYEGTADYNATVRINSKCMFSLSGVPEPTSAMHEPKHRCGEAIHNLTVTVNSTNSLSWESGTWKGNTRADLEAGLPDLGDYRLLVCGFNLENYFMTWGSMGADSYAEHQDQRAKISKALKQINADIFGLVELQKGDAALAEIVSDLNANLPKRNYKYFSGDASADLQKVDFVYDANTVTPLGTPAYTDEEVAHRKKMVYFIEKATGEKFIYSINHFKAMNTGDEYRRVNEARAVVKLYNRYRTNTDHDVLIMGDLNCYAFTEPIKVFLDHGLIDMHRAFHADTSYSYMYGGLTSYIDHALCNETMYRQITGMAGYHLNSDEDDQYNYQRSNDKTMFRCSDHDPVLVGLKLDSTLVYDPTPTINSLEVVEDHLHNITIRNGYHEGDPSYYAIYNMRGDQISQGPISNSFQEVQLPDDSGLYILYIYAEGKVYQKKFIMP